jgi:hypothetical protein
LGTGIGAAVATGYDPLRDDEQLAPALQHQLAMWRDKAYPDDNLFLTLARRPAVLDLFLSWALCLHRGLHA